MKASNRAILVTTRGLERLAAALRTGGQPGQRNGVAESASKSSAFDAYVTTVFQSLAMFRFFTFAMGGSLIFVFKADAPATLGQLLFVVFVGLYNVGRVIWRLDPATGSIGIQWLLQGSDTALGVALVLAFGGLDSPFLIYSLTPILTASLLMDPVQALAVAALSTLTIVGAHVASNLPEAP